MAGSSMRDIKRRIRSVTNIEHITNAMKLVSGAKLRRARNVYEKSQGYLHYITDNIDEFFVNADDIPSRYVMRGQELKRACYILVTSNRGLAGSYNTNIIKIAERAMQAGRTDGTEGPALVCIGGRGSRYFSKRGYNIISEYLDPPETVTFFDAREIAGPVIAMFDKGEIDEVVIVYTAFKTTIEQRAVMKRLLPFEPESGEGDQDGAPKRKIDIEYDPGPEEVLHYLVPKYAEIMLYQAIIEAATCEHAARRMAMQNATDNALEMIDELDLSFNRARQAAITKEITEIVSGADAVK